MPDLLGKSTGTFPLAVCGLHLSGQPLNHQLTDLRATLARSTLSSADYKLYAISIPAGETVKCSCWRAALASTAGARPPGPCWLDRYMLAEADSQHAYVRKCLGFAGIPERPGLVRVLEGGISVPLEIWHLPVEAVGQLLAFVGTPLSIGQVSQS